MHVGGVRDGHLFALLAHFQFDVDLQFRIHVDGQSGALVRLESRAERFEFIVPHRQYREGKETLCIGVDSLPHLRVDVPGNNGRIGNRSAGWVLHGP